MKNLSKLIFINFLFLAITSCVSEYYAPPKNEQDSANCVSPDLVKTKDVQDIYNLSSGTPQLYTADDIIEGIVTSSDEGGNFFKSVSFISVDKTRGFSISIDAYNLNNDNLQPGRKVFIKLKGLYTNIPTGGARGLVIGGPPSGTFNTLSRIPAYSYKDFVFPTCTIINEEDFVKKFTVLSDANNDIYLNTLVEFDKVQFESKNTTYGVDINARPALSDKNENITDGITSLISRTGKFANFAGSILPSGNGKIRGVLTKFNSAYQIIFRTERDIKLLNDRKNFDFVGGSAAVFTSPVTENFESYLLPGAGTFKNFPKYINYAYDGGRFWALKQFPTNTGNKFIEMSSFNGTTNPGVAATTYFMVPVDFTSANTFKFSNLVRFNRGQCLNVYYVKSTDVNFAAFNNTAFVNITSSFNIIYPSSGGSASAFTTAGTYNLPATLTGNGYFVFEYVGTTTNTTTMQIDDIVIN